MYGHVNCPECGIPTIPDRSGLSRTDMLCEKCSTEPVHITVTGHDIAVFSDGSEVEASVALLKSAPSLRDTLRKLATKARSINAQQHAGVNIHDDDWADLDQITNESFGLIG